MKNILNEHPILGSLAALLAGLVLGAFIFRGCRSGQNAASGDNGGAGEIWTCSMDPQVKQDRPGKCPICGMDLIKAQAGQTVTSDIDPDAVMLTDEALALAGVETCVVGSAQGDKQIRLFGKIEPDQRQQQSRSPNDLEMDHVFTPPATPYAAIYVLRLAIIPPPFLQD